MAKKDDEFTFEIITQVYREELNSTTLTKLPPHFYHNLMIYIEKLRERYFEERNEDPTSPRTIMLEDEFNKVQRRATQIFEYRERKIALLALSAVKGGEPNTKLMTGEEKSAFEDLVDTLSRNRSRILSKKKEDACEPKTFLTSDKRAMGLEAANEMNDVEVPITKDELKVKEESESLIGEGEQDNPVLLILEDIPSFVTGERTFNLRKDDVVSLPSEFSRILCKHGKARVIQNSEKK